MYVFDQFKAKIFTFATKKCLIQFLLTMLTTKLVAENDIKTDVRMSKRHPDIMHENCHLTPHLCKTTPPLCKTTFPCTGSATEIPVGYARIKIFCMSNLKEQTRRLVMKGILKFSGPSNAPAQPVGPDLGLFVWNFLLFPLFCEETMKAVVRLCGCAARLSLRCLPIW